MEAYEIQTVDEMQEEAKRLYKDAIRRPVQDLGRGYWLELGRRVFGPDGRVVTEFDDKECVKYKEVGVYG